MNVPHEPIPNAYVNDYAPTNKPMRGGPTVLVFTQTQFPQQSFNFQPGLANVTAIQVDCVGMANITSTGTSLALACPDFAISNPDYKSVYTLDANGSSVLQPIAWIQPYPLPTYGDQLYPFELSVNANRTIQALNLTLLSNGTLTFAMGARAEWRVLLYRC